MSGLWGETIKKKKGKQKSGKKRGKKIVFHWSWNTKQTPFFLYTPMKSSPFVYSFNAPYPQNTLL